MSIIPKWLHVRRERVSDDWALEGLVAPSDPSREPSDTRTTQLLRDVAFNRHSMNDGHHVSPLDNGMIQVGDDGIMVQLVQGIDEAAFKRTIAMATRATIGLDLHTASADDFVAGDDADEMLRGGLQTALETAVVVFAVSGVSRTCTHQLVRSRRASFHQQSQRASYYGDRPEARMPESIWNNPVARNAFIKAKRASDEAYRIACEQDISYQDARYSLLEATDNYIMLEYSLREFMAVYDYRGCSMFSWEIVTVMRKARELLVAEYPWLADHIKISCERTAPSTVDNNWVPRPIDSEPRDNLEQFEHKCTFQGWESVEGQCPFTWAKERNRTFQPKLHQIKAKEKN